MEKLELIEYLCSKGHRGSTTGNERWAAGEMEKMFSEMGLHTKRQDFMGSQTYGEKLAIHLGGALILAILPFMRSDLMIVIIPLLGFLIASFYIEATYFIPVLSSVFPKRGSQNILAIQPSSGTTNKRILLVAHVDSQKEGSIFDPKLIELMKGFASPTSTITPIHLTFLSIVGLLISSCFYLLDLGNSLSIIHGFVHLLLFAWALFSFLLVAEWMLNDVYVPGANDNASGVAVMMDLCSTFSDENNGKNIRRPENRNGRGGKGGNVDSLEKEANDIEMCYLITGCEETGLGGAVSFIKEYRDWLNEKETCVMALDGLGSGNIHYFTGDGMLKILPYDQGLIETAREVAKVRFGEERPFICRVFTDGLAFSANEYRTITFGSLEKDKLITNYHWHTDTPENIDKGSLDEASGFLEAFLMKLLDPPK